MPSSRSSPTTPSKPARNASFFDLLPVPSAPPEPNRRNLAFAAHRRLDDPRSYVLLERHASRQAFR